MFLIVVNVNRLSKGVSVVRHFIVFDNNNIFQFFSLTLNTYLLHFINDKQYFDHDPFFDKY